MGYFQNNKKTNWMYVCIVLGLSFFVAGGILVLAYLEKPNISKSFFNPKAHIKPETKAPAKTPYIFSENDFAGDDKASYLLEDLNNDGSPELIILAATSSGHTYDYEKAYIGIFTILGDKKNYKKDKKIGELIYGGQDDFINRRPEIISFEDIDGDGQEEIFINLGSGGASCDDVGFLKENFQDLTLNFLKMKDENNIIGNAIRCRGGSAGGGVGWELDDLDNNGKKEFISFSYSYGTGPYPWNLKPTEVIISSPDSSMHMLCSRKAYEWDGLYFSFNLKVSQLAMPKTESLCKNMLFGG